MRPHIKQFVFRVSNGNNKGPFNARKWKNPFHDADKFSDSDLYPDFLDDGLTNHDYMHIAALPNACALFHWFGEDLDVLNKNKFRVHRIEVKKMYLGRSGNQVTYHRLQDKIGKMQVVPIKYKGLLL
jgi:hypothetical protein